jgi:acetyl esterase/lipase
MDVTSTLDPELAEALAAVPRALDFSTLTLETIPKVREAMATANAIEQPPTTTVHRDVTIPDPSGASAAQVRVYSPPSDGTGRPCLYWVHGGGYMFGSAFGVDTRLDHWVERLGCVVVSVEYRLAPEHPFPAPLDDCYAGLVWTAAQADELGIDPGGIVVGGASAGGGLAAGLVQLARDRGEVPVSYQLLIYPMLDDRNVTHSSRIVGAPIWPRDANLLGWRAYLGREPGGDDMPAFAAPARTVDLSGLPPAFIGVGTLDVFRDEDIDYALRLLAAGVPTELHVYAGAVHGFDMMVPSAAIAKRCRRDVTDALTRAMGLGAAESDA